MAATRAEQTTYALLFPYMARYRRELLVGGACLLVTNLMTGATPKMLGRGIDAIQDGSESGLRWALLIAATAVVMSVIRTVSRLKLLGVSREIAYDIRKDVYEHILHVRAEALDRIPTGDVMSRLTNDLMLVRGLTGPGLMYLLNTLLAYAVALSFMVDIDPYLTAASLVPFPLFIVAVWLLARRVHARQKEAQERLAALSSRVQEDLNGIWAIKAHAREAYAREAFLKENDATSAANMRLVLLRSLLNPVMGIVGGVGTLLVLVLGGRAVIQGRITLGEFVAFTGYLGMIAGPTVMMGWIITLFQRARVATSRLDELLRMPLEPVDADPGGPPLRGAIRARDLTFAYPGSARPVLDGLSLDVPPGAVYGIYGPTGSGKTTLLRLLARLYDPPPGTLSLGGEDVAATSIARIRRSISCVPQDPFLFRATIKENVAFAGNATNGDGDGGDGIPRVREAISAAAIQEEVEGFPAKYETLLGERGITLSGGQRARVTLARALYEPRPFLLLDDPFAAVDVHTEHEIIGNLRRASAGVTTLLVTHRVKALANADRILVMDRGRIVDAGSHDELLGRPGPYLEAFREQRLVEELEAL